MARENEESFLDAIIGGGADAVLGARPGATSSDLPPELQQLADQFGIDINAMSGDLAAGTLEEQITSALAEAALEVSGIDLFDYQSSRLPHWFPDNLRKYARQGVLHGVYDPYWGSLAEQGDERVFMGTENTKVWVGVQGKDGRMDPNPTDKEIAHDAREDRMADQLGEPTAEPRPEQKKKKRPATLTVMAAKNLPYQWDEDEVAGAMKKMRQAGHNVTTFDQLTQMWGALVDRASMTYSLSQGKRKVSPWDVLELTKRESIAAGTWTDYESGSKTTTHRSVTDISEGAAWQTLRTTLSTLLGRDPSDQELRDYTYRMNQLAAQNPSITKTITQFQGGEAVSQSSTTTGGFDAGDMAHAAYEDAQDDPEYARVQGGTTYFNAMIQALGEIGGV